MGIISIKNISAIPVRVHLIASPNNLPQHCCLKLMTTLPPSRHMKAVRGVAVLWVIGIMPSWGIWRCLKPHDRICLLLRLNTDNRQRLKVSIGDAALTSELIVVNPCFDRLRFQWLFRPSRHSPLVSASHGMRHWRLRCSASPETHLYPGMAAIFLVLEFFFHRFHGDWRLPCRHTLQCRFSLSWYIGVAISIKTSDWRMGSSISCSPVGTNGQRRFIHPVKNLHTLWGSICCRTAWTSVLCAHSSLLRRATHTGHTVIRRMVKKKQPPIWQLQINILVIQVEAILTKPPINTA